MVGFAGGSLTTIWRKYRQLHVRSSHFRLQRCGRWPHAARSVPGLHSRRAFALQPCPVGLLRTNQLTGRAVGPEVAPHADRRDPGLEARRVNPNLSKVGVGPAQVQSYRLSLADLALQGLGGVLVREHLCGRQVVKLDPDAGATCLLYTSPSPRDRQKSRMP